MDVYVIVTENLEYRHIYYSQLLSIILLLCDRPCTVIVAIFIINFFFRFSNFEHLKLRIAYHNYLHLLNAIISTLEMNF